MLSSSCHDLSGCQSPRTITYDAAGRLTGATYPAASGLTDATYTYDPVGNRLSADGVQYTYDAADRLTSDGTYTYAYDDSGNVTSRTDIATGAVTSFDWNAQHQLLAVHHPDGATTTTYAYDALGRRIGVDAAGQTTGYVYDGANIHLEYDGGSLAAVYTTGLRADSVLEMTRGGQNYYYLQDGLGSTTALTNAAGTVVDRSTVISQGGSIWNFSPHGVSEGYENPAHQEGFFGRYNIPVDWTNRVRGESGRPPLWVVV